MLRKPTRPAGLKLTDYGAGNRGSMPGHTTAI